MKSCECSQIKCDNPLNKNSLQRDMRNIIQALFELVEAKFTNLYLSH